MKRSFIFFVPCVAALQILGAAAATRSAADGFKQLQSLAGEWLGTDEHGQSVRSKFQMIASSTAVMETLTPAGMEEMVTLYSVDRDAITLVHYCPTNNQPRMRALPRSDRIGQLVFEFQGAGNLDNLAEGHEHIRADATPLNPYCGRPRVRSHVLEAERPRHIVRWIQVLRNLYNWHRQRPIREVLERAHRSHSEVPQVQSVLGLGLIT
jgi:hypothetical protein